MIVYYRDDGSIGVQWANTFELAWEEATSLRRMFENITHIYITEVKKALYAKKV